MKKTIIRYVMLAALFAFSSCKLDGLLDNPNNLSLDQANNDFLLNSVQLEFGTNFFNQATGFGMDNLRMRALIGGANYNNNYQPVSFDGMWSSFYATMMPDIRAIIAAATPKSQLFHTGIARTLEAYSLATMVDYFGSIPWTEAFDPTNFNPQKDSASALYDTALAILDHAILDFTAVGHIDAGTGKYVQDLTTPINDMFYGGLTAQTAQANWIAAAKTIKLKLYVSRRLADPAGSTTAINALIAAGGLISATAQDFQFNYPGNSISNPDTRHPFFTDSYINGAGAYMSNSYMLELLNGKGGFPDPRLRYYFYRQSLTGTTNVNLLSCAGVPRPPHYPTSGSGSAWCIDPSGYWGRDHLNNDGTGPDNRVRTAYGIYPGGGKFDNDDGVQTAVNDGNGGFGIWPILTTSFVKFLQAEAVITLGTTGDAKTLLLAGVSASISKVKGFPLTAPAGAPPTSATTNYSNAVGSMYDAAPAYSAGLPKVLGDKLQVVLEEYWVALWGNGIEAYNMYRRTGKPDVLQPARNPLPGDFYRSFIYPNAYVTLNNTAHQKSDVAHTFWDTNPAGSSNPETPAADWNY